MGREYRVFKVEFPEWIECGKRVLSLRDVGEKMFSIRTPVNEIRFAAVGGSQKSVVLIVAQPRIFDQIVGCQCDLWLTTLFELEGRGSVEINTG